MLTKEECLKSYKLIKEVVLECFYEADEGSENQLELSMENLDCLFKQLIEEHFDNNVSKFDNPPLTLDEIKTSQGVPIWDNKIKEWIEE